MAANVIKPAAADPVGLSRDLSCIGVDVPNARGLISDVQEREDDGVGYTVFYFYNAPVLQAYRATPRPSWAVPFASFRFAFQGDGVTSAKAQALAHALTLPRHAGWSAN